MEKKQGAFRTTIGGQALIEGILMRGPEKDAIVVRSPEGLVTKVTERKFIKDRYPILGIPILRGAVTFISSMITGVKALMFSADYFPDDEDAQPSKFDQWLEKHIPAEKLALYDDAEQIRHRGHRHLSGTEKELPQVPAVRKDRLPLQKGRIKL